MTTHPLCAVDQRPVHDGGLLCPACWHDLEHDLTELAEDLLHDLDRQLAGLTRTGGSPIGIVVRAEKGLGFDERAGDLLRQLHNCLGGWVRVLCEDNALPLNMRDRTVQLASWLYCHEREVRRHEAVGELWGDVHKLVEQARRLVTPRPPKVYLGMCSVPLDDSDEPELCDEDLYGEDGQRHVLCRKCGASHVFNQRREVMLDAMPGEKLTAAELTRAFAGYRGIELKADRLRQWAHRGKIYAHPPREGERAKRYRVAAVRRLLDREVLTQAASAASPLALARTSAGTR